MTKKEFMKKAIEPKICRAQLLLYLIIYSVFFAISIFLVTIENTIDFWKVVGLLMGVLFILLGPFMIYYLYRIIYLIKNFDNYQFLIVEFKNMHAGLFNRAYFTVCFEESGKKISLDTRSIFLVNIFNFIYPNFEDYLNQKVKIAYNKENEEIVVIEPIK